MIPLRDDNPHFLVPFVNVALIGASVAAWVLLQGLGLDERTLAGSVCELGLIPGELLHTVPAGTRVPLSPGVACVLTGDSGWLNVLSSMFLHGSWWHLIGNMWFLWIFGNNIEDAMGHARYLCFYLLCGLAAAAAQVFSAPTSVLPMVGASGAIGGVMGAYIVLYPRVNVHMVIPIGFYPFLFSMRAVFVLGYWFVVQLAGGATSIGVQQQGGVAFWAHVGGFVAGALLIFLFRDARLLERHPHHGWRAPRRASWQY